MSNLTFTEKRKLEKLLGMNTGYVLNFSDRTFRTFIHDHADRDINDEIYKHLGTSKANRLRKFWEIEQNHLVGKVLKAMITYGLEEKIILEESDLVDECRKISRRLLSTRSVSEIDSLTTDKDERDFEIVAQHVHEAIEKNQPEGALDRLHTYVVKYIRMLCKQRGIEITRDKPLHSIFGEYIKDLKKNGHIETEMTILILKSSISILDAFNNVRNEKSLAHDNHLLNYEEGLLIFNYIASLVRFIKSLETKIKPMIVNN